MTMDRAVNGAAVDVEQFSKQGALKLKQKNLQKALEAYQHAYQRAQLLGHNGYLQRACAFNLAAVYILSGSYNDGLMYLKQAEPLDGCRDGKSNGDLYFNYGLAHEGLRNTKEAAYYYKKAMKEYEFEDNVSMKVDTLSRLGKVCVACSQYSEAEKYKSQLIQLYEQLVDTTKQLQCQAEQANLLLRLDQVQKAEMVADICFTRCQEQEVSHKMANVLIELSLAYTQIGKYDKALHCCQSALPIVQAQDTDVKQVAVLYQNLGVIHNYLGRYRDAIQYHQTAAKKYGDNF